MTGLDIQTYNKKRDFSKTKEPRGATARKNGNSFVVQKHDATRLHYDFRLEMDGVLKSWAVTKGPSLDPADKRLAVRTEDHPISYGSFEGTIPAGEYGGGTVMLWDIGTWTPIDDPQKGIKKGHLHFELHGERLKGKWNLIRMRGGDNEKRENWLLIKDDDDEAVERGSGSSLLDDNIISVTTGASMEDIAGGDLEWGRGGARKKTAKKAKAAVVKKKTAPKNKTTLKKLASEFGEVQLATLVTKPPTGADWVHEVKFDGYRILCLIANGEVMIRTRNGHDWTHKFPSLAAALATLDVADAVLDGEAVLVDDKGKTAFGALQNALGKGGDPSGIQAYFFDLLQLDGKNLSREPLLVRKKHLEKLMKGVDDTLHYSEHMASSSDLLTNACKIGLEGIISKRADASYSTGRGRSWLKSKCNKRQEFVIIGYTAPKKGNRALGALHLGYYAGGELKYAGKCGTGFSHKHAQEILDLLEPLARKTPAAAVTAEAKRGATWVEPKILCEASFTEWTSDGHVRHPSFEGLRSDKKAKDVVHEEPMPVKQAVEKPTKKAPVKKGPKKGDGLVVQGITITNPDRVIFKDVQVTKGELAEYYGQVAPYMLKQIAGHPLSLLRCPGGADAQCFFQRNPDQYMKNYVKPFPWDHKGNAHEYLYIEDAKGLVFLAQMGAIEMHPWAAPIKRIDYPNRMIFDLDPDEGIDFEAVKLGAMDVRARLKAIGLQSFVKTTGGKGLHITVPLDGKVKWPQVKAFAASFAGRMVTAVPDAYVATMAKAKRKGKIFIDYFRNDYTATAIADYSVRARKGAAVATPLCWEELKSLKSAAEFDMAEVLVRLKKKKDANIMPPPQTLPKLH
ncbi:MAG: DNA ligase D [bacterium]|nr:DNA ligase D [bacterium]